MEYLQYNRRQYGLLKYGRYPSTVDPEADSVYSFSQARIRAHIKNEDTNWTVQHKPLKLKGNHMTFRLRANEAKFIYSRRLILPGYFNRLRLRSGEEVVISQIKNYEGGAS